MRRIIGWDIHGLESAVKVYGKINDPSADNEKWTVELKIPWFSLRECAPEECWPSKLAPDNGEVWRLNFSRVEYDVDVIENKYVKRRDDSGKDLPEHNWVWAPTGIIDIHMPEMWGYLVFTDKGEEYPLPLEDDRAKLVLRKLYYREHAFACKNGRFTDDVKMLLGELADTWDVKAYITPSLFEGVLEANGKTYHIRQDGFTWEDDEE